MADKRVVVADDEPHIRHVICLKMERGGFDVQMAADGEEALDLCRAECPDLLITDYQMPVMSGLELCQALQADPATAGLPIIMLTARGFDLTESEHASAGITELMSKPFSPAEVLLRAQELVSSGSVAQES